MPRRQRHPAPLGYHAGSPGRRRTWTSSSALAQNGDLVLPLTGQVDQLVKTMTADDVAALLYEQECTYLGRRITPLASSEGGL